MQRPSMLFAAFLGFVLLCASAETTSASDIATSTWISRGNGWCLNADSERIVPYPMSWHPTEIREDGSSQLCEEECHIRASCAGYMTEDRKGCQLVIVASQNYIPKNENDNTPRGIQNVDQEQRNHCWMKEGGPSADSDEHGQTIRRSLGTFETVEVPAIEMKDETETEDKPASTKTEPVPTKQTPTESASTATEAKDPAAAEAARKEKEAEEMEKAIEMEAQEAEAAKAKKEQEALLKEAEEKAAAAEAKQEAEAKAAKAKEEAEREAAAANAAKAAKEEAETKAAKQEQEAEETADEADAAAQKEIDDIEAAAAVEAASKALKEEGKKKIETADE